jgi:hypothetical protein
MSEVKQALVLHVAGLSQPVLIALDQQAAQELTPRLLELMSAGLTETVTAEDGLAVTVNYKHVVTAHIEVVSPLTRVYGSAAKKR